MIAKWQKVAIDLPQLLKKPHQTGSAVFSVQTGDSSVTITRY